MTELALNILDIANNSTRANAKNITISIVADFNADTLCIEIVDDGCGMDEQMLKRVTDPFSTTRTTRRVGMGLPLFKMATNMCDGDLQIFSKVGQGTTVKADFKLSHIDRAPLGDLACSFITLIGGAPKTDFVFKYQVDGQSYQFCTAEAKQQLQTTDLTETVILSYIQEMIHENLEIVNGGKTL